MRVVPRQPLMPGFNPDPTITRVEDTYYLVTSSFEWLPGLPVYRSTDLSTWEHIGNVISRPSQADLSGIVTPGGVWAPTIRYRDGVFHVIVTVMFGGDGCVLFTTTDPSGPWSDPVRIPGVTGIDPDLAWDEDGVALVTYSVFGGGIHQIAVDLSTGASLDESRELWSGTGLHAAEGPHLYHRGDDWYLMIAEGGTERGHAVSIARGPTPRGPFEGAPGNPVLSARSTGNPVQNVGHADMVDTAEGDTLWVVLGVRPAGFPGAFSPLGRETFVARVDWVDGWPVPELLPLEPETVTEESFVFSDPTALDDPGWLGERRLPSAIGSVDARTGALVLTADGEDLGSPRVSIIGRRVTALDCTVSARMDCSDGVGGLVVRHSEVHWLALQASTKGAVTELTARASLSGFEHQWHATVHGHDLTLSIRFAQPPRHDFGKGIPAITADLITLAAVTDSDHVVFDELDGRYLAVETTGLFTGRVAGVYATSGTVRVLSFRLSGNDGGGS